MSVLEEPKNYNALIGFEMWSSVFDEDDSLLDEDDEIEIGTHGPQIDREEG